MVRMFEGATSFDQPLPWDTSSVINMGGMFHTATSFNQPLPWNTSSVTDVHGVFLGATSFSQPIGAWDTLSLDSCCRIEPAPCNAGSSGAARVALLGTTSVVALALSCFIVVSVIRACAVSCTACSRPGRHISATSSRTPGVSKSLSPPWVWNAWHAETPHSGVFRGPPA